MKTLVFLLLLTASLAAKDNVLTKTEAEEGWVLLFDGQSLLGWTSPTPAAWRVENGLLQPEAEAVLLRSNSAFTDFSLRIEYRVSVGEPDCSLFLRVAAEGDPRQSGYGVQIGDARPDWPTGSIVDHSKARSLRPEAGQWHAIDATASDDRIAVKLDNYSVAEMKNVRSHAGYVALSCAKGARVQFRNIKLKPLEMKALFNGTDLAGWKMVAPPPPEKVGLLKKIVGGKIVGVGDKPKEAAWSVVNEMVHVEKGTGQLETAATYDDFILQLTMRVNSRDRGERPKSSVFVRGDAGKLFTGYEIKDGGPTSLKPTRTAATPVNEFFTETVVARGRHIQVWVDGVPISDVQDTRAEGSSPQKDARTAAGTISLQAFDDKANLDFRSLRVLALPKALGKIAAPVAGAATLEAVPLPGVVTPPPPGQQADPTKAQVQQLMKQALATSEPSEQVRIYGEILLLDPNNQVAFTGRQQAQQKLEEAKAREAKTSETKAQAAQSEEEKKEKGETAKQEAENELVAGHLAKAQVALAKARELLPDDPTLSNLDSRISDAQAYQDQIKYAMTGAGVLACMGAVVFFIRNRGEKVPYLEVVSGLEKGKRYTLDNDVTYIGAIQQDGGQRNDVVVRDLEHRISRFHCEFQRQGKHVYVIDNGSANGTKVDKKRAPVGKAIRVKKGSRIELAGACVLKLGMERAKADS